MEPERFFHFFFNGTFPSTVASTTLAMSIKLTKNWIQARRREQHLEKEKLETELKFLKYQFNPHFLFNTINSIFFLIHKNPDVASSSLAKFSELLRYQLYECNDKQISLNKEVAYLNNFIELERLRQNKNILVSLAIASNLEEKLSIAPFILMTFVENAFKHVSKEKDQENWIKINLHLDQHQLNFTVSNSTAGKSRELVNYGGIGLQNVKRRLDLIYPDQHDLQVRKTATTFEVNLELGLSELYANQPEEKKEAEVGPVIKDRLLTT